MKAIFKRAAAAVIAAATLLTAGCASSIYNGMADYDFAAMNTDFIQLSGPSEGDTIAIIDTDYGEIRVVLYKEQAPNTVGKFIANAESGYYDNMPVCAVMNGVYFLTGGHDNDKGLYTGRESDDELIENEYNVDLWPFKGALLSYSEKMGFSDSRWFVCNTDKKNLTPDAIAELKDKTSKLDDETTRENMLKMFDAFYENGGVFGLAGYYTVFGQTYEGIEVVEKLCAIPVNTDGRTTEEVMIKSVTISKYSAEDASSGQSESN